MSEKNSVCDEEKIIDAIKELTKQVAKLAEGQEKMRIEFKKWNSAGKF